MVFNLGLNFNLNTCNSFLNTLSRLDSLKSSLQLAVNESYIDMNERLQLNQDDEIAVLPPLSGG